VSIVKLQRVGSITGTFAAAFLATSNAFRFLGDPILAIWLIPVVSTVGFIASVSGASLAYRRRDLRMGMLATGAAASIALPALSSFAPNSAVEIVRFLAPAALFTATAVAGFGRNASPRLGHLILAASSCIWLIALVTPGALVILLAVAILGLWTAWCLTIYPLLHTSARIAIQAWKGQSDV
jgi:hypothetical protein